MDAYCEVWIAENNTILLLGYQATWGCCRQSGAKLGLILQPIALCDIWRTGERAEEITFWCTSDILIFAAIYFLYDSYCERYWSPGCCVDKPLQLPCLNKACHNDYK